MARATDDSANLGAATSASIRVGGSRSCPCNLFGDLAPTQATNDNQAIEVGVRFRADVDGFVTGLRYYGAASSAPRVGHLWTRAAPSSRRPPSWATRSSAGTPSRSRRPCAVTKDTTYVASFLSTDGTYYADAGFFNAAFDAAPLHAPAGTNGVYKYGGGFPTDSFDATSYGADVLFTPTDQTPPQVAASPPAAGAAGVDPGARVRRRLRRGASIPRPSTPARSPAQRGGSARPRRRRLRRGDPHRHAAAPVAAGLGDHVHRHGRGRRRRLRRPRRQPAGPGPHVVVHHRRAAARLQRPRRGRDQGLAVGLQREPARVDLERGRSAHRPPRTVRAHRRTGRSGSASRAPRARAAAGSSSSSRSASAPSRPRR